MKITTIGIDLAKDVFQVHGIDERVNRDCFIANFLVMEILPSITAV